MALARRAVIEYARLGPIELVDLMGVTSWKHPRFRDFVRDFVTDGEKAMRCRHGTRTDLA